MKKIALLSLLAAGLLAAAIVNSSSAQEKAGHTKAAIGQPAPAFSLEDQNGKPVNLADYTGKIVVLEWFNEGCPFVQKFYNAGKMNELAKKYEPQGVVWLAINTTRGVTQADDKSTADKWSIDRPILLDQDGHVARAYGAKSTPHMFIIDKDGKLAYSGAIDDQPNPDPKSLDGAKNYVTQALDEILAGKPVSEPETKSYGCGVHY